MLELGVGLWLFPRLVASASRLVTSHPLTFFRPVSGSKFRALGQYLEEDSRFQEILMRTKTKARLGYVETYPNHAPMRWQLNLMKELGTTNVMDLRVLGPEL